MLKESQIYLVAHNRSFCLVSHKPQIDKMEIFLGEDFKVEKKCVRTKLIGKNNFKVAQYEGWLIVKKKFVNDYKQRDQNLKCDKYHNFFISETFPYEFVYIFT